ncbi:PilZ domain-containing protein [Novosphingobium sp.]|uniref:PilZ domain-containing protein n=1 Tax=Novosphingobium sp. TaxID=1874826 RepID=UPI003D095E92
MALQAIPFVHQSRGAGRRQAARVRLALPGKVILVSGHEPCLVDDLSLTGASVSIGRDAPPIGDSAVLMVNGIEAFGTVVWHSGVHFGLCFEEPVTRDDLVRLRGIHDHFTAIEMDRQRRNARDFVQGRPV